MDTPSFVIVTFVNEDDAPGIVASNWINPHGNTCYYPNVRTEEMKNKLLRKRADPDESWPQYQIKILKRYETYNEARLHLKKAEETSNLDSDDEVIIRKRKIKRVYSPEDSDSPDYYPTYMKTKKTQPSVTYPIPPKHLLTETRKSECTEKMTKVAATNSTVEVVQNKVENLTPAPPYLKSRQLYSPATFHWQSSIVPYVISDDYDGYIEQRIMAAMRKIMRASCVVFQHMKNWPPPGQPSPITYLSIQNPDGVRECTHTTMREDGVASLTKAVLVIGYDCMRYSEIMHALLHGLGFSDEVTHPQRDQYIRVMWGNIQPKYQTLFWKQTQEPPHKIVEYDPMSVMHFHDRAFSVNGAATILPVVPGLEISPSSCLSQIDVLKLQLAFGQECNNRKLGKFLLTCQAALNDDEDQEGTEESHPRSEDSSSEKSSSEEDNNTDVLSLESD